MPMLGHYLDIKRFSTLFSQYIDCGNQRSDMNRGSNCFGAAEFAIEVPKINAWGQSPSTFTLDVFTNVVFDRIEKAIVVFTLDVEKVGFFQALVPAT